MAGSVSMDFECPQFVDFAAELSNCSKDDLFFDCKDCQSPANDSVLGKSPAGASKQIHPSEVEENRLLDKMTAALSVIENTPKLKAKAVKGKLLAETFATNFISRVKPSFKANTIPASSAGLLHRSKSIARLNKLAIEHSNKSKGLRKRSSSLNDLRAHKKQTYPMTPMCLKRTIIKGKGKVLKSTEERELEEIAKLQKQLIQHLRYNELSLKRLKLKSKPVISKTTHAKTENVKGCKGLNPAMEKEPRRNIHALNGVAVKHEAMKINTVFKAISAANKPTDKGQKDNRKSKNPVSSVAGAEVNDKSKSQTAKKPVTGKKIGFHSGLVFHDNVRKSTTLQPFSFDVKVRERIHSIGAEQKSEISLSNSTLKYKVDDGKENIPYNRAQTTGRRGKTMHSDIVKQLAANKKIFDERASHPVRGLPLSENFARN